ncbi:O-antigen ligase family protein [Flavobacterium soyae]|uniref:O-antigen ligase family protein n=1 Tax=Flavobacterium soyae TaxID=2903098 RepID=UPI001E4D3D58|nr:O-antigen ligase family protein [Flavobacterium soyae]MCD9574712.1 O-antigen ligase family protein [Flavobacterium soyae]
MKIDIRKVFLVFLPFTQALTLNIFFPLKISEIALVILLLFYINKKTISRDTIWFFNNNYIIVLVALLVTLSFIVNIYWNYPYPPKVFPFRINRVGDSFIRVCYFYLCLAAYFVSYRLFKKDIKILETWVLGAIIAAVYGWYLFISSKLNIPYFKLPGIEEPQMLEGFIRSSTFKEGNYFGLFLLLSASVSFYLKKMVHGWFLLFSVIVSMSTISILSVFIFIFFFYKKELLKLSFLIKVIPVVIIGILILTQTEFYQKYVYGKLFDPTKTLTQNNFSKADRIITGNVAFYSGIENPFFGVGPANYGLHYDHYNKYKKIVVNRNAYFDHFAQRKNERAIPNNVYLEVFSEYGVIASVLFLLFLFLILTKAYYLKEDSITAGIICIILSFNAFPSFIMLFIWVFLAIPFAIHRNKLNEQKLITN